MYDAAIRMLRSNLSLSRYTNQHLVHQSYRKSAERELRLRSDEC